MRTHTTSQSDPDCPGRCRALSRHAERRCAAYRRIARSGVDHQPELTVSARLRLCRRSLSCCASAVALDNQKPLDQRRCQLRQQFGVDQWIGLQHPGDPEIGIDRPDLLGSPLGVLVFAWRAAASLPGIPAPRDSPDCARQASRRLISAWSWSCRKKKARPRVM